MATIDSTLEEIMRMDYSTREMLLEILQKRQVEARRDEIAKNAKKTLKNYRSGKLIAKDADDVINHLDKL